MPLEIAVNQTREQVHAAMLQFAAQRGCSLTKLDRTGGMRLEAPGRAAADLLRGFQAMPASDAASRVSEALERELVTGAAPTRVEIHLFWRRGKTVLAIDAVKEPGQIRLVEELRTFLTAAPPAVGPGLTACPQCGTPVANALARFCGRCGKKIANDE